MTVEVYNHLLEVLIEISNWEDPDEFTISVERRRKIYLGYAGVLQSKLDLLPAQYNDDISRMIAELQSRIDNDEAFLNRPDVARLPPEVKLAIRRGLRDGRRAQLRTIKEYWKNMLAQIAAEGVIQNGI